MYKERLSIPIDFGECFPTGKYYGGGFSLPTETNICPDETREILTREFFTCEKPSQQTDFWRRYYPSKETFLSTERKRPAWNDCTHIKHMGRFSYPYSYALDGILPPYPLSRRFVNCTVSQWISLGHDPNGVPLTVDLDDFFRSRAIATMTPRFESDFQALNFLFELKDFKEVPRNIASFLNPNSKFWTGMYNLQARQIARSKGKFVPKRGQEIRNEQGISAAEAFAGKASSAAAKLWLTYAMAVLPTLKDLTAYAAAAATEYKDALSLFRERGMSLNTRHYSEYLVDNTTIDNETPYSSYMVPQTARRVANFVKATASIQYKYKYILSDESEAFARYWGLTGTLEEFWNMLPFSFLVDYVFQVARALRQVQLDKNLELETVQYAESRLCYMGTEAVVRYGNGTCCILVDGKFPSKTKWTALNGVYNSSYNRAVTVVPNIGLIIPRLKLPSVRQRMNMVALARTLLF